MLKEAVRLLTPASKSLFGAGGQLQGREKGCLESGPRPNIWPVLGFAGLGFGREVVPTALVEVSGPEQQRHPELVHYRALGGECVRFVVGAPPSDFVVSSPPPPCASRTPAGRVRFGLDGLWAMLNAQVGPLVGPPAGCAWAARGPPATKHGARAHGAAQVAQDSSDQIMCMLRFTDEVRESGFIASRRRDMVRNGTLACLILALYIGAPAFWRWVGQSVGRSDSRPGDGAVMWIIDWPLNTLSMQKLVVDIRRRPASVLSPAFVGRRRWEADRCDAHPRELRNALG